MLTSARRGCPAASSFVEPALRPPPCAHPGAQPTAKPHPVFRMCSSADSDPLSLPSPTWGPINPQLLSEL